MELDSGVVHILFGSEISDDFFRLIWEKYCADSYQINGVINIPNTKYQLVNNQGSYFISLKLIRYNINPDNSFNRINKPVEIVPPDESEIRVFYKFFNDKNISLAYGQYLLPPKQSLI